jgi:hypothetical protein
MTCTEFLALLDDLIDNEVSLSTTRKTIEIYRSHEIYDLPAGLRERLHAAIMARCKKGC